MNFGTIFRCCSGCLIVSAAHGAEQPAEEPSGLEAKSIALVITENEPVSPAYARRLVWSDEFDDAALDPAKWFAETGDGSEYSIPGWGNTIHGVLHFGEEFPATMEIDYVRVYSGGLEPE